MPSFDTNWQPNVNPETGIRYGIVSLNSLADWVFDEFLYHGTDLTMAEFLEELKAEGIEEDSDEWNDAIEGFYPEESCYSLDTPEGLHLGLSYLGGAPLVWVYQSPVIERARLCSPCVPNAGNLDSRSSEGEDCYSLPDDWWAENSDTAISGDSDTDSPTV